MSSPLSGKTRQQSPVEALALLETAKKLDTQVTVSNGDLRFATLWEKFVSAVSSIPRLLQGHSPSDWKESAQKAVEAKFQKSVASVTEQQGTGESVIHLICTDDQEAIQSSLPNYIQGIKDDPAIEKEFQKFVCQQESSENNPRAADFDDTNASEKFGQITTLTAKLMSKGYIYDEALSIARGTRYLIEKHGLSEDQALDVHRILFLLNSEGLIDSKLSENALLDHGYSILKKFEGKKKSDSAIVRSERNRLFRSMQNTHRASSSAPANSANANHSGVFVDQSNEVDHYPRESLALALPAAMKFSSEKNMYFLKDVLKQPEEIEFFQSMEETPKCKETRFVNPNTDEIAATSIDIGNSTIVLTDISSSFVSDSSRQEIKVIDQRTGTTSFLEYLAPLEFIEETSKLTGLTNKNGLIYLCNFFCQDFLLNLQHVFLLKNQTADQKIFLGTTNGASENSADVDNVAEKQAIKIDETVLTITKEGDFLLSLTYLQKIDHVINTETSMLHAVNQSAKMQAPLDKDSAGLAVHCEITITAQSLAEGRLEAKFTKPAEFVLQIEPASPSPTTA